MEGYDVSRDPRYMDIGDLPSGGATYTFDRIYLRQFDLQELPLLHYGMTTRVRPHEHIIRAVSMACNVDITQLTDGDFCYVMAWLRRHSYPDFPVHAKYTCLHPVWTRTLDKTIGDPKMSKVEAKAKGYIMLPCGGENTEMIHRVEVVVYTLDDDDLVIKHPEVDFARVSTLNDYYMFVEDNPHAKYMAGLARWVKSGTTFRAKYAYLKAQKNLDLWEAIEELREKYFHGITEKIRLRCGQCNNVRFHETEPSLLKFFADNTEQDIYNMSYNLMSQFGVNPDMKSPAKMFMYHHNQLAADRRAQEQKLREQQKQQKIQKRY